MFAGLWAIERGARPGAGGMQVNLAGKDGSSHAAVNAGRDYSQPRSRAMRAASVRFAPPTLPIASLK